MIAQFPSDLVGLACLLLVNRVAASFLKYAAVFWLLQAVNLAAAVWFGWVGVQGIDDFPIANYIVCALLVFHMVQNVFVFQAKGKPL